MNDLLREKRVLVTGVNGQVGRALVSELGGRCELIQAARSGADINFDLENFGQIQQAILELKPDIVINPAAYTQVDQAEEEPDLAMKINGEAPGVIAEACKNIDALLVHYSTDYVFSGDATTPYKEDVPTKPINTYGRTKLEGEQAIQAAGCRHLIFRTCWVYDAVGRNFVNAILAGARTREQLKVVNDQLGTPTSAPFIASVTRAALEKTAAENIRHEEGNRIYNLRPDGYCSWYDFACEVISIARRHESLLVREILPVGSDAFPTKARRPAWSVLDNSKISAFASINLNDWKHHLRACMETMDRDQ